MSRQNMQMYAPVMSSGRSRGSSSGQGGFSYTHETTTINTIDSSGRMTHYRDEVTRVRAGSSSANRPLRKLREEGSDSDSSSSSDEEVGGRFSKMSLGGRSGVSNASQSTIRGPRLITLSDADVERSLSGCPSTRTGSRRAESNYSGSRTNTRPSESHYSGSRTNTRPSESHYSGSRTTGTDSRRHGTRTSSSRHADSHYSGSRPSVSHSHRPGKELVIYEEPISRDSGSKR